MRQKKLFKISAGFYLLSGFSVLLMGNSDISGNFGNTPLAVISALIFWLSLIVAITAHLRLRKLQKPYRRKQPIFVMLLSPPTVFFEAGGLITLLIIIILSLFDISGFMLLILLSLLLICSELSVLTLGKFRLKNGKIVFKIYKIRSRTRS